MNWTGVHLLISAFDSAATRMVTATTKKEEVKDATKTAKSPTDQTSKKAQTELKIFKARKVPKSPTAEDSSKTETTAKKDTSTPAKKDATKGTSKTVKITASGSLNKQKRREFKTNQWDVTGERAVRAVLHDRPLPSIEVDPDEGKLKISSGNNSVQKIQQTIVMNRRLQQCDCQIHVVARKARGSVDNLNGGGGPTLRNEFFYPQRQSVCATFTLDRPKKLATISPKSPGLVSQHKNSAFTSSTSLNNGTLNSRSMSSHQLLNQLNQQQSPLVNSVSSTTINSTTNGVELATTDTTPVQSPTLNTLGKFPASNQDLSRTEMPVIEEQTIEQTPLDPQKAMIESVNAKTATLADKLSRSFFDLTQGSQDRLARWKSKLQQYGQQQRQRSSEKESTSTRRMASLDGSVPQNDVMVVDWRTEPVPKPRLNPPKPMPRPLHSSRSATNALTHGLSLESTLPLNRTQTTNTSTATLPHSLHKSASVRDADVLVEKHKQRNSSPHTTSTMEHRTLKQRENVLTGRRSPASSSAREQHLRSLHELVQSIEGFQADKSRNSTITLNSTRGVVSHDCGGSDLELPPPAKIMPFSGIKPQDQGIIRPIAFRPLANSAGLRHGTNRHSNSPDSHLKPNTIQEWPTRDNGLRMRTSNQLFGCKSIGSLPTADENAYDVVPEYINEPSSNDPNYSSIYPFQQPHSHRTHSQNGPKRQHNFFSTAHSTGTTSTSSGSTTSPHNRLKKSISGSQQNVQGHSNNSAHITPSPSDSGIILDYESLIRDKENELTNVREAMEKNEEVLIRVYQEKERQYKQQIDELKQKLHNVQKEEGGLRKQLRQSEDVQQQLRKSVQNLNDEKLEMQQKCVQIERELSQLRTRVEETRPCDSCRRQQSQQTQSIYENNGLSNGVKPVPAPRLVSNKEHDLRSEVDDLKSEVSMLREQLNRQVEFFGKRWEQNPTHLPADSSHLNNNLPAKKPTHFSSAINGFAQQRSLSEKRPILSTADRLI